ncbi:hypothetical protein H9L01_04360 [Erysipelothrix inopinata]|uniref:LPXTG cell wall anchor domain-containing protein n=1 Tax=Erysipelothrix inopinata TaxID=225084 RepID=A0A7G9S167_9FIRM|nr:hypothetical protein [Erysipelothrix inopinata]QNN61592.1 hypothetical protein H9L01_04360 [Erysipelothrix inopinata]
MKQWYLFILSMGTLLIMYSSLQKNGFMMMLSGIILVIVSVVLLYKKK